MAMLEGNVTLHPADALQLINDLNVIPASKRSRNLQR